MSALLTLPESFALRVQAELGDAYPAFLRALAEPPPVGIRRNFRKLAAIFPDAAPIPWCPTGAILPERPTFALDPLWHAGAYYVQEPSSMLLDFALRQFCDSRSVDAALDLCAAPGGKTTLLADYLDDASLILANEPIRKRFSVLRENVARWGSPNIVCTNHDPAEFAAFAHFFQIVLVDAPCSGEGLFRKDPNASGEWSEENAALCALRQRRIMEAAAPLVCGGGLLFYSTCTFNLKENDAQIAALLTNGDWDCLTLNAPPEWGLTPTAHGVQCWPHRVCGEGFYLAVLRRKTGERRSVDRAEQIPAGYRNAAPSENALARPLLKDPDAIRILVRTSDSHLFAAPPSLSTIAEITQTLPRYSFGVPLGIIKGKDLVPAHELALSPLLNPALPSVELSHDDALRFLRKENPLNTDYYPKGWLLMRHHGTSLGWGKAIPGRFNNYLPMEWRLRIR